MVIKLTFLAGYFNHPCDGDHVSWDTAVYEVLGEFTLDGSRDSSCLSLIIGYQLLNSEEQMSTTLVKTYKPLVFINTKMPALNPFTLQLR